MTGSPEPLVLIGNLFTYIVLMVYVCFTDDCFILLTMNTAQFSRICMAMARDLLTLHTQDFSPLITDTITEVFKAQLLHFEDSLKNSDFKTEVNLVFIILVIWVRNTVNLELLYHFLMQIHEDWKIFEIKLL